LDHNISNFYYFLNWYGSILIVFSSENPQACNSLLVFFQASLKLIDQSFWNHLIGSFSARFPRRLTQAYSVSRRRYLAFLTVKSLALLLSSCHLYELSLSLTFILRFFTKIFLCRNCLKKFLQCPVDWVNLLTKSIVLAFCFQEEKSSYFSFRTNNL
jgi:hypothetical protein